MGVNCLFVACLLVTDYFRVLEIFLVVEEGVVTMSATYYPSFINFLCLIPSLPRYTSQKIQD
jgi:hypothetical protein